MPQDGMPTCALLLPAARLGLRRLSCGLPQRGRATFAAAAGRDDCEPPELPDAGAGDRSALPGETSARRPRWTPSPGSGEYAYKLLVQYDGTNFAGWQLQLGQARQQTIQGLLEAALEPLTKQTRKELYVVGAGRTDAGVHARGQVAHFRTQRPCADLAALRHSLNSLLPMDVRVLEVASAPSDFHARYSATGKTYHYSLWVDPVACPFTRRYHYHLWQPDVDTELIRACAAQLVGRHNFYAFANKVHNARAPNPVRTIQRFDAVSEEGGRGLRLEIQGSGFLYKQVRNMVGACVAVARGRVPPDTIARMLATHDRELAPKNCQAPASGLCLHAVEYADIVGPVTACDDGD